MEFDYSMQNADHGSSERVITGPDPGCLPITPVPILPSPAAVMSVSTSPPVSLNPIDPAQVAAVRRECENFRSVFLSRRL
jgi:hypothetical protein